MACEPDVALFKTASDSLDRMQILADFCKVLQNNEHFEKDFPKLRLVVFSCHIARLAKLVWNW